MKEKELEETYLVKYLPKDLKKFPKKEIIDFYFPKNKSHPTIRIRKIGEKYELTKKEPINKNDLSFQEENSIELLKDEYKALIKIPAKKVHKIRYYYRYRGIIAEIGVHQGSLKGLVMVDFEFKTRAVKNSFIAPDFCLARVTQEEQLAGGRLAGHSYKSLEKTLNRYHYMPLKIKI